LGVCTKLKIKIVVSLSIFLILLSAAFSHQQQQYHQEYNVNQIDSDINNQHVVPIDYEFTPLHTNINTKESNQQWKLFEPFKPREYVRIIESY
jgi:hypothetical protein